MKTKSSFLRMRELRAELHYWQQRVRIETRGLKATIRKCKEIAVQMRELQKGEKHEAHEDA